MGIKCQRAGRVKLQIWLTANVEQFLNCPNVIGEPCFHSGVHADCAVGANEIGKSGSPDRARLVVLPFLADCVGEAGRYTCICGVFLGGHPKPPRQAHVTFVVNWGFSVGENRVLTGIGLTPDGF